MTGGLTNRGNFNKSETCQFSVKAGVFGLWVLLRTEEDVTKREARGCTVQVCT